jgi:hypothetical protein
MQISAQSKATPKSNPNPRSTVKLAQYHSRKYFRRNSFEKMMALPITSCGSLIGEMGAGAGVLKSDCTKGDPGVDGMAAPPRLFSCHDTQRTGSLSVGR